MLIMFLLCENIKTKKHQHMSTSSHHLIKKNMDLEIIYQDEYFVAINKPHGLLVHRSSIAADAEVFALQLLRDQIQQFVYPIHRLDRKTSGVLLFGLDKETTRLLQKGIEEKTTIKEYWAIVRGHFPPQVLVDYPLTNDDGKLQDAITKLLLSQHFEIDVPLGLHSTSRYSLIQAFPETGRMHQIRKHCNHLRHPIIGDRPHGCNKQNKLFKERWEMTTMMLHAKSLSLQHPITNLPLKIEATLSEEFQRVLKILASSTSKMC